MWSGSQRSLLTICAKLRLAKFLISEHRMASSSSWTYPEVGRKLELEQFGDPKHVLKIAQFQIPKQLRPNQVILKIIAAPVHPADINIITGVYGAKPSLPTVPGLEAVAKILEVGNEVENFKPNDLVVPIRHKWGTWRTHHVCDAEELFKIPEDIRWQEAASIVANPVTAYRMLVDFVSLKVGDSLVQNGANSAVGQAVIQIAREMGFKTINIVRSRPDIADLKKYLHGIGADYVLTEEETLTDVEKMFNDIPRPKLAMNCVGGRNSSHIFRWLQDNGKMIVYGGMSRQPTPLPVGPMIFKDISVHGFWLTKWRCDPINVEEFSTMMKRIVRMAQHGTLRAPPSNLVPLSEFQTALSDSMKPYVGKKQILIMED